jgi:hypothetical protein
MKVFEHVTVSGSMLENCRWRDAKGASYFPNRYSYIHI